MDFLPLLKNDKRVYAGFWKRFCAGFVDMLIWIPVAFIIYNIQSINITVAIFIAVFHAFFFSLYSIYLNLRYGGTLGKLAMGIRVTKPDGKKIGLREALLRSSVDIAFGVLFAIFNVYAIGHVNSALYLSAGYVERAKLLALLYPKSKTLTDILMQFWFWSEMIVLLLNKRKRALHDFIAGTVVINKEFATNR